MQRSAELGVLVKLLRDNGHRSLAQRLRNSVRARGALAHPDAGLAEDLANIRGVANPMEDPLMANDFGARAPATMSTASCSDCLGAQRVGRPPSNIEMWCSTLGARPRVMCRVPQVMMSSRTRLRPAGPGMMMGGALMRTLDVWRRSSCNTSKTASAS